MRWTRTDTPLGPVLVTGDEAGLHAVLVGAEAEQHVRGLARDDRALAEAVRQLDAWFAGQRTAFELPLAPPRTDFGRRVREALVGIPYGTTTTYGALARALGGAGASRAVGTACARNPLAVVVPCHRVVGADGTLTGFAAGLPRKRWLLDHESAHAGSTLF